MKKNWTPRMVRFDIVELQNRMLSLQPMAAFKWFMQVMKDVIAVNTDVKDEYAKDVIEGVLRQHRVKQGNVAARHGKERKDPPDDTSVKYPFGHFKNVMLTAAEEIELKGSLGKEFRRSVEYLSCWKVNHARQAKNIRSDYAAIVQWVAARISEERRKEPRKSFRQQDEEIREQRLREALPDVFAKYGL